MTGFGFISLSLSLSPPSTLDPFLQSPSQQKWDLRCLWTSYLHTTNTQTTVRTAVIMQTAAPLALVRERPEETSLRELLLTVCLIPPISYSEPPPTQAHRNLLYYVYALFGWVGACWGGDGISQPLQAALHTLFSGLFAVRAAGFRPLKGWIPSFDLLWLMGSGKALQLKYTEELKRKK